MSRYNLLEESWIEVVTNRGEQKEVSLLDLFRHAEEYRCLAGEMETQNFAMLRFLLAIVQTVFSRYDSEGEPYPFLETDSQMRQIEEVDEDDADDYADALEATWDRLWQAGHFPEIVCQYLETWRDHFYLYDDKYPFFQVTEQELKAYLPEKKPTKMAGRNFNRLISESGNKTALFSPIAGTGKKGNKDQMTAAEMARWLLMLQGYIGLSDKVSLVGKDQKPSKGWLFDLGSLYLEGDNLYETLLLNEIPVSQVQKNEIRMQSPCWEMSGKDNIERLIQGVPIRNLAQLYTNWSRAIYVDPEQDENDTEIEIVKLPAIAHEDNFLEPMTVWHFNETGVHKEHYTPKKHRPDQAMWRSFGLITMRTSDEKHQRRPEILSHLDRIQKKMGSRQITIHAVGMQDDGNATSWVPVDEITDTLNVNDFVVSDTSDAGWIIRINDAVDMTKQVAAVYRGFLLDIARIRNQDIKKEGRVFADSGTEDFYQALNEPFRNWLARLQPEDSKDDKISEWYKVLKRIAEDQVQMVIRRATPRDYIGIEDKDKGHMFNIVTAYQKLKGRITRKLG
ncbi:type I-E CRISPR-associated protein Cse1/CasA [Pseudoramibacter sp.]|jgi:CRISPR system Cascade subunit CasA|uniref:type I-E CRISPR-associated protein Cse1/CasA n=1 Tax=Pseudoramibacter sp. TaxID=2034862 RepID=UPI0025F2F4CF|nr:type I-E CRISPR-associated protein Cse1/CasA [Pseudoramibacter sp.]MCH4071739.1 type I-E CRISPR-associated protein Cse1/CasA [Pseudoramibacter sp.]MCH4105507.1 type I-E CRISPR-associated protein Cse1/CasA [Pseudoramibacter sp.]